MALATAQAFQAKRTRRKTDTLGLDLSEPLRLSCSVPSPRHNTLSRNEVVCMFIASLLHSCLVVRPCCTVRHNMSFFSDVFSASSCQPLRPHGRPTLRPMPFRASTSHRFVQRSGRICRSQRPSKRAQSEGTRVAPSSLSFMTWCKTLVNGS